MAEHSNAVGSRISAAPLELWIEIASHFESINDLKNLSLASHLLFAAANPFLWRFVSISAGLTRDAIERIRRRAQHYLVHLDLRIYQNDANNKTFREDVVAFLVSLPQLTELELRGSGPLMAEFLSITPSRAYPKLHSIWVHGTIPGPQLSKFLLDCPHIRKLYIKPIFDVDYLRLDTLHHLDGWKGAWQRLSTFAGPVDTALILLQLPRAEITKLRLFFPMTRIDKFSFLTDPYNQLMCPSVEELTILTFSNPYHALVGHPDALDRIYNSLTPVLKIFPNLRILDEIPVTAPENIDLLLPLLRTFDHLQEISILGLIVGLGVGESRTVVDRVMNGLEGVKKVTWYEGEPKLTHFSAAQWTCDRGVWSSKWLALSAVRSIGDIPCPLGVDMMGVERSSDFRLYVFQARFPKKPDTQDSSATSSWRSTERGNRTRHDHRAERYTRRWAAPFPTGPHQNNITSFRARNWNPPPPHHATHNAAVALDWGGLRWAAQNNLRNARGELLPEENHVSVPQRPPLMRYDIETDQDTFNISEDSSDEEHTAPGGLMARRFLRTRRASISNASRILGDEDEDSPMHGTAGENHLTTAAGDHSLGGNARGGSRDREHQRRLQSHLWGRHNRNRSAASGLQAYTRRFPPAPSSPAPEPPLTPPMRSATPTCHDVSPIGPPSSFSTTSAPQSPFALAPPTPRTLWQRLPPPSRRSSQSPYSPIRLPQVPQMYGFEIPLAHQQFQHGEIELQNLSSSSETAEAGYRRNNPVDWTNFEEDAEEVLRVVNYEDLDLID